MPACPLGGRPRAGGSVILNLKLPPARRGPSPPRRHPSLSWAFGPWSRPGHWAVHWQCTAHTRPIDGASLSHPPIERGRMVTAPAPSHSGWQWRSLATWRSVSGGFNVYRALLLSSRRPHASPAMRRSHSLPVAARCARTARWVAARINSCATRIERMLAT
jgi:hypothetical protein